MADAQGALEDAHILELTERITNDMELMDLGVKVLKLPKFKVQSALFDKKEIRPAALSLFGDWMKNQGDRQEAYNTLHKELETNNMKQLAAVLKRSIEGPQADGAISKERFETIQGLTKRSLSTKPFCLVPNKEWSSKPGKVDLRMIYTELAWETKTRRPSGTEKKPFDDYESLLKEVKLGENTPVRVLVQAEGGMGKTTVSKHMAISWADNTSQVLGRFHITFHIALKKVKVDTPIENIIIEQHCELEGNQVSPEEIKNILEGKSAQKVLIIIDGHDEYKPGTNSDIDRVIMKRKLANCSLILTSRETEQIAEVKDYMDVEAEIRGFKSRSVRKYIEQSLGSEQESEELLQQAESSELCHSILGGGFNFTFGFFQIPIFLNMICVLFKSSRALPTTKTEVMDGMTTRYMAREDTRKGQQSAVDKKSVLVKLGKLAWAGLVNNKFIFSKDEVAREAGSEALELGLLIGTEDPHPSEEEADMLCFPHLLFQEFVAAHYIAQLPKEMLESLFSKWGYVLRHQDVVKFACVLTDQTDRLLEVIYATLTDYLTPENAKYPEQIKANHQNAWYQQFLQSLQKELPEKMQFDAFHNKHFNYTTTDDTRLFISSGFYAFDNHTPGVERLKVNKEYSDTHRQAHSSINVTNKSSFVRALNVLKYLQTTVGVVVHCMCFFGDETIEESLSNKLDPEEETQLLKQGLKFGDSTKVISLFNLQLSQSALKYIINQLTICKNLTVLHLANIQGTIPLGFGASIRAMTSLKCFHIEGCKMTEATVQKLMLGLSQCLTLQYMVVMNEKITGSIAHFCGGPGHPGFPSLDALGFMNTQLNLDDINSLADAMRRNIFPSLEGCNLSGTILTDTINTLFVEGGILSQLVLQNCSLSKHDVENVLKASATCLKCELLDLSGNTLTGVIGALCSNVGLPFTEILNLPNCNLVKEDFKQMSSAIGNGKLPNLQSLDLSENDLRCIQTEVEELVKACVTCYSMRGFNLYLSVDNMEEPVEFMGKINSMCDDTGVCVKWNMGEESEIREKFKLKNSFPPGLFDGTINPASLARLMLNIIK